MPPLLLAHVAADDQRRRGAHGGGLSASTRFGVMFLVPHRGVLCPGAELHAPVPGPSARLERAGRGSPSALAELGPGGDVPGVCRWFWAIVVGVASGSSPRRPTGSLAAISTRSTCLFLVELFALGAVYAQMALLASLLHDDPLGANPVTVIQGIVRIGWSYARPCLVSGVVLLLWFGAFVGVYAITNPLLGALGLWAFWVMVLYLAMVALRVLGLCYHHRSRALGWFVERPRWGV